MLVLDSGQGEGGAFESNKKCQEALQTLMKLNAFSVYKFPLLPVIRVIAHEEGFHVLRVQHMSQSTQQ